MGRMGRTGHLGHGSGSVGRRAVLLATMVVVLGLGVAVGPSGAAAATERQEGSSADLQWTAIERAEADGTVRGDYFLEIANDETAGATAVYVQVQRTWYGVDGMVEDLGREAGSTRVPFGSFAHDKKLDSATLAPVTLTLVTQDCGDVQIAAGGGEPCAVVSSRQITVAAEFSATGGLNEWSSASGPYGDGVCTYETVSEGATRGVFAALSMDGQSYEATGTLGSHGERTKTSCK